MANSLRYLKLDFESHRDALVQRVQARYPTIWNDFLSGSVGILLVDLMAWSTATLAFIINRVAAENFIPTMTLRESAVRAGALVNYQLRSATPATVAVTATISTPIAYPVTIKAGTQIRTSSRNNLVYEVDRDYTIAAGSTFPQTLIATFSASTDGLLRTDYATNLNATQGASFLDLIDTSINLLDFAQPGMYFLPTGSTLKYTVTGISAATDAISSNRLLISPVWATSTGVISGTLVDPRITLLQGQTVTDTFLTSADTQPNYVFRVPRTAVITGSVEVTMDGTVWTAVPSLLTQDADAPVFQVTTQADGTTVLNFGDGIFGATIPQEATCRVTYRVGGGVVGNIAAGAIQSTVMGVVEAPNVPVSVAIANPFTSGSGGLDAETLEEARVNIPAYTRSGDKAVTLDDFQTLARQYSSPLYGSIAQARASSRKKNAIVESNLVTVFAWVQGASRQLEPVSTGMRVALQDYLQTRCMATDYVLVAAGQTTPVPISVRVFSDPAFDPDTINEVVLQSIQSQAGALIPGQPLIYSDLVRTLDSLSGVENVTVATPSGDLFPSSDNEVFTPPDDQYEATILLQGIGEGGTGYQGFLPASPVAAWGITVKINGLPAGVTPDNEAGFARIVSSTLHFWTEGLLEERPVANAGRKNHYYFATDVATSYICKLSGVVYAWITVTEGTSGPSRIDTRTGRVTVYSSNVISSLTVGYNTVVGFNKERRVDVFVDYEVNGSDSQTLRKSIRDSIQKFFDGVEPGGLVYASEQGGVLPSVSNLKSVVAKVEGVAKVNRVALETAGNDAVRVEAVPFEQLRMGTAVLNSFSS